MNPCAEQKVLVFGLGTFGGQIAVARYFAKRGARVTVTDKKPREKLEESVRELDGLPIRFVLGEHKDEDIESADLVVRSPAVPQTEPHLGRARRVTTEIVLTLSQLRAPFAAVTGTKGKSTTTALLGKILEEHAGRVFVGGNIGRPLLETVHEIRPEDPVVFELSSFMAEDLALARRAGEKLPVPSVLILTSLAPEHLDRHGTKEAYYEAKLSLMEGAKTVIFPPGGELEALVRARAVPGQTLLAVTADEVPAGILNLPGEHNRQNAALAARAARLLGASDAAIERGLRSFEPLPHRLETVARDAEGRRYVNDSIATTPEAAIAALTSFGKAPVVLMLGGSDKGSDFSELAREAARRAYAVVCTGTTGGKIAGLVTAALDEGDRGEHRGAPILRKTVVEAARFEDAFALARALCPPGGVLLLSPACASYDSFKNFEDRGRRFAALARAAAS